MLSVYPRNTLRGHVLRAHKGSKAAMIAINDGNAFRYEKKNEKKSDVEQKIQKRKSLRGKTIVDQRIENVAESILVSKNEKKRKNNSSTKKKQKKRKLENVENIDLEKCMSAAVEAARRAGKIICSAHGDVINKRSKGGVDLVTKHDDDCEKACFQYLKLKFPSYMFIGEESSSQNVLTNSPTWIVDPIDGTHNFVHGQANVAVAIGLSVRRKPVLGVVYNPIKDELFTAIVGKGSFLNGMPIRARNDLKLSESMVLTGIGHSRKDDYIKKSMAYLENLIRAPIQCVRMLGSCALGMCEVARGTCSSYYEFNVGGLWDTTASAIIVRESGASCQYFYSSREFELRDGKQHVICGHPKLLNRMRDVMFSPSHFNINMLNVKQEE